MPCRTAVVTVFPTVTFACLGISFPSMLVEAFGEWCITFSGITNLFIIALLLLLLPPPLPLPATSSTGFWPTQVASNNEHHRCFNNYPCCLKDSNKGGKQSNDSDRRGKPSQSRTEKETPTLNNSISSI